MLVLEEERVRLYARQGFRGQIVDLDTGRTVPRVLWFDTDQGELEAFAVDEQGALRLDGQGNFLTVRMKGRFRFVPRGAASSRKIRLGAPQCALCGSSLTLLGDDLCPGCRAAQRHQKHPMRVEPLPEFLLGQSCEHSGCDRPAVWSVADEVEVTPQQSQGIFFQRGATVGRHFYCSHHWQPPRLLDERGEVIEKLEDSSVRPE
jgi:hypothetical protein